MNTVPTVKHGGSSIMFLGYFAVSGTITLHRVDGIMKEENFSNLFHIYLENYKEMGVAQDFCIVPYLKSSSHMRLYECFILQRFHNLLSSHFILHTSEISLRSNAFRHVHTSICKAQLYSV